MRVALKKMLVFGEHLLLVAGGQLKRRCVLAFFQKLPPCLIGIEACATSA